MLLDWYMDFLITALFYLLMIALAEREAALPANQAVYQLANQIQ